jgi:hypothetical protein
MPPDKRDPLRESWEELRHTERWAPPLLAQLDEAAVFIFRDAWPRFTAWLRRSFPRAAQALPSERWAALGWAALGLLAVDGIVGLGPRTGHNVTLLLGFGLAGYAGWQVWRRMQQMRRDDLAQLGAESMELRIAALGALDQLAYDNPRYRLPLVHLLGAWLDGRGPEQANGRDGAVARKMVEEFTEMLAAEPSPAGPATSPATDDLAAAPIPTVMEAQAGAEPAPTVVEAVSASPAPAEASLPDPPAPLAMADEAAGAAEALPSQEHTAEEDGAAPADKTPVAGE